MTIPNWKIEKINVLPPSLESRGYQLWYWAIGRPYIYAPLRPLTQEYWQEKFSARLAYGIYFPEVAPEDGGGLLIMLSQDLEFSKIKQFGGPKKKQRLQLYDLIVEIDFNQVRGYELMPVSFRNEIFQKYEMVFREHVVPRKDHNGRYYRGYSDIEKYDVFHPDAEGMIICPKCKDSISVDDDLWILSKYTLEEKLEFINAICGYCKNPIGIRIDKSQIT